MKVKKFNFLCHYACGRPVIVTHNSKRNEILNTIIVNTYDIFLLTTFSIGLKPIIIPGMSDSGKNNATTATTQTKKPSVQTGLFLLFAVNELDVDLFAVER